MINIQTASLEVPGSCPNKCKFCVSEINKEKAKSLYCNAFNFLSKENQAWSAEEKDFVITTQFYLDDFALSAFRERLLFLRQKNVDTLVLTGAASEPILNKNYLELFRKVNQSFGDRKFVNIECQTSGVGLTNERLELLKKIGVKTISLSLASLDEENFEIERTPEKLKYHIPTLCRKIKEWGFNLRLSLNLSTEGFSKYIFSEPSAAFKGIHDMFADSIYYGADQVTFKKLYFTVEDSEVNKWIKANSLPPYWWSILNEYIKTNGKKLHKLMFGAVKYSCHGLSTVIDEDCMNKDESDDVRYIILYRNCKLYTAWDDPASLVF